MVGSYEGNVLYGRRMQASVRAGGPIMDVSKVESTTRGAVPLGNRQCRKVGGNTGFLFLRKHKIQLNSSVLPSILNHLENIFSQEL